MSHEKLEYDIALDEEAKARNCSARLLRLRDNVRELPHALAAYVKATRTGERERDTAALNLYHALPAARRVVALDLIGV